MFFICLVFSTSGGILISGPVSIFRSCLDMSGLISTSSHILQSVVRDREWDRRLLQEWNVDRESSRSCILVVYLVDHSKFQPSDEIFAWPFDRTFLPTFLISAQLALLPPPCPWPPTYLLLSQVNHILSLYVNRSGSLRGVRGVVSMELKINKCWCDAIRYLSILPKRRRTSVNVTVSLG